MKINTLERPSQENVYNYRGYRVINFEQNLQKKAKGNPLDFVKKCNKMG